MCDDRPWPADSACVGAVRPSPNHNGRVGRHGPDCIVLHYTGMRDGPSALDRLTVAASEVSCHYVVDEAGLVTQLVPEARRAWHAGRSFWAGETDLNSASVGIEIVNGGHDFGLPAFPEPQIAAVTALCRDLMERHGIVPSRILAHSDVAPGRKQDPGERFPWAPLAQAGVGLWVRPSDDAAPGLVAGMAGPDVARFKAKLARYGYGLDDTPVFDAATVIVVEAFQRRFRPSRVDGQADAGTRDTLARLVDLRFGPGRGDPAPAPARA